MHASVPKLVVIDDDRGILRALQRYLVGVNGWAVRTAPSGEAGLELIATELPDVVLMDVLMPACTGIEVAKEIHKRFGDQAPPVVLMSGSEDFRDAEMALLRRVGVIGFLEKPFSASTLADDLMQLVEAAPGAHWRRRGESEVA